jgi:hypothetical protein
MYADVALSRFKVDAKMMGGVMRPAHGRSGRSAPSQARAHTRKHSERVLEARRHRKKQRELLVEREERRLHVPPPAPAAHARQRGSAEPRIVVVAQPAVPRRELLQYARESSARRLCVRGGRAVGRAQTGRRDLARLLRGRHDAAGAGRYARLCAHGRLITGAGGLEHGRDKGERAVVRAIAAASGRVSLPRSVQRYLSTYTTGSVCVYAGKRVPGAQRVAETMVVSVEVQLLRCRDPRRPSPTSSSSSILSCARILAVRPHIRIRCAF